MREGLEPVDIHGKKERFFQLSCSGVIESGELHEDEHLTVSYEVFHGDKGKDWTLLEGKRRGIS